MEENERERASELDEIREEGREITTAVRRDTLGLLLWSSFSQLST